MERLKMIKDKLINCVESQVSDLSKTNAEELGEVVDMIKDIEETIYYATITKAMKENEEEKDRMYYPVMYTGPRYYTGNRMPSTRYYEDDNDDYYYVRNKVYPKDLMRDYREGRSGEYRRTYMESKEMHEAKEKQMHDLEKYLHELSGDVMDMVKDSTPEEKQVLSQKLETLADKIK